MENTSKTRLIRETLMGAPKCSQGWSYPVLKPSSHPVTGPGVSDKNARNNSVYLQKTGKVNFR